MLLFNQPGQMQLLVLFLKLVGLSFGPLDMDPKLGWDIKQRGFDLDVLLVMVLIRNLLLLVD